MKIKYCKRKIEVANNSSSKGWGCFARCCNLRVNAGTDMRYA